MKSLVVQKKPCKISSTALFPITRNTKVDFSVLLNSVAMLTLSKRILAVVMVITAITISSAQQEMNPPSNSSYFVPYGDRILMAMQFPNFHEKSQAPSLKHGNAYGVKRDKRGFPSVPLSLEVIYPLPPPPPKLIYVEKPTPNQPLDYGVISSQNFIYRQNIRDDHGFNRPLQNARPSDETLIDWAKQLLKQTPSKFISKTKTKEPLSFLPPDLSTFFHAKMGLKKKSSFVVVALESREKFRDRTSGGSYTNGSILFPSSSSPNILSSVPFVLEDGGDINTIFDGNQNAAKDPHIFKEMLNFVKLVQMVHTDTIKDGRNRREKLRVLNAMQKRERLPDVKDLAPDDRAEMEVEARLNHWLVSSTVAIRAITPPPPKMYKILAIPQVWKVPHAPPAFHVEYGYPLPHKHYHHH